MADNLLQQIFPYKLLLQYCPKKHRAICQIRFSSHTVRYPLWECVRNTAKGKVEIRPVTKRDTRGKLDMITYLSWVSSLSSNNWLFCITQNVKVTRLTGHIEGDHSLQKKTLFPEFLFFNIKYLPRPLGLLNVGKRKSICHDLLVCWLGLIILNSRGME